MEGTILLVVIFGILSIILFYRRPSAATDIKATNLHPSKSHGVIDPTGDFDFEIVGEFAYQEALYKIWDSNKNDGDTLEKTATLFLENDNPHDDKAVRVDIDGLTVGYFSRIDARTYRKQLKLQKLDGVTLTCSAQLNGCDRNDDGDIQVSLDLPLQQ